VIVGWPDLVSLAHLWPVVQNGGVDVTVTPLSAGDDDDFVAAVYASRELHHPWIDPPDTAARFVAWLEHASRATKRCT
jgi:hypothetical protein